MNQMEDEKIMKIMRFENQRWNVTTLNRAIVFS